MITPKPRVTVRFARSYLMYVKTAKEQYNLYYYLPHKVYILCEQPLQDQFPLLCLYAVFGTPTLWCNHIPTCDLSYNSLSSSIS